MDRRRAWDCLLVVLAGLLPYLNALDNGFALDDFGLIVHNEAVRSFDLSFLFTSDYWAGFGGRVSGLYRPLTSLSFALDYRLWGERPFFFHLTNLLLHLGCCLLVYRLATALSEKRMGLAAALSFAVHPVHTEAVAGVAGRADLLSSLWVLAGLLCWLREGRRSRLLGAPLFLFLGLLCKEQAVVLPGLAICGDWFLRRERRPWAEYGPLVAAMIVYLVLRQTVLEGLTVPAIDFLDNPLAQMPVSLRLGNGLVVLWRYAGLLVFPHPLSADYSHAALPLSEDLLSLDLLWAVGMVVAAVGVCVRFYRRVEVWSLGGVWWLVAMAPVANLLLPIGTVMAERLLYLPSVGFALVLSSGLARVERGVGRRVGAAILAILLLVYAGRTRGCNFAWKNNESLFRAVVEAYPRSAKGHEGLATELKERGDLVGALEEYRRALEIYPEYRIAHYNLGLVYWELRQYERARESFARSVELKPNDPKGLLNLGAARHALGDLEGAERAYLRAVEASPGYAAAWQNLGDTYWEMGEAEKAAAAYRELLRLSPAHPRRAVYEERMRGR